jgi:iron complex outermembrane receptor protein
LGVWGVHRDYQSVGAETLAPATKQNGFAVFTVQNVDVRAGTRVQVGGRLEHNGYTPVGARARSFTGFSGSAGVSQRLWEGGAFAVNFTHSFRAPALEELYNNGPHPGNATFEIGNVDLMRERSDGVDVSLRHQSSKARVELNYFYYRLADFIFFRQTGQFEDGLPVANYEQGSSRYRGFEARFDAALHRNLWLNLGADAVNARLTADDTPLPRIPPVRGRVGVDARFRGFSVKPELVLSNAQRDTYPGETATAGYAVANLQGSYTIAQAHAVHVLSVNVFNAGDALYRNHLSLLKAFAPEIGRGVRFTYSLQVF